MATYPSRLVENAVNELSKLPGIGKKTALRLTLHLLKETEEEVAALSGALQNMRSGIQYCTSCHNISDSELCDICADKNRDNNLLCVVQDIRDVLAIENTQQYRGLYHVLGGIISPMEGIGPADLTIEDLVGKVKNDTPRELIMALPATMEGDTTNFYIYRKIKEFDIKVSTIARGVSIGNELEFTDEVTLGRSIVYRVPYKEQ
ncbi:MAG: recombination mediator RecR [Bacteroidetes bacterium]|nr:recombination mediator RecR [Bacteroidota bacterium]